MMAVNHQEPDRVPIDLGTTDTFIARNVYIELARLLGLSPREVEGPNFPGFYVTPDEDMLQALGADVRLVTVRTKPGYEFEPNIKVETLVDGTLQWTYPSGMTNRLPPGSIDVQLCRPAIIGPLTDAEIQRVFPPAPQAADWVDAARAQSEIESWHARGMAVQCPRILMPVTGTNGNILDFTSWCLAFSEDPDLVCRLMDACLEHLYSGAESYYEAVGGLMDLNYGIGDDVAQQNGLWMSPRAYRKYIKPRHAEIIRWIRTRSPAKIIHHCCGACSEILPDLIEIGVDILNPTQTTTKGMDPFELKRLFGRDLTFWGGIDVVNLLPNGTTTEVESAVKRHLDALAPGGGYVFAPSHIILPDCKAENVLVMYRTALEYGRY